MREQPIFWVCRIRHSVGVKSSPLVPNADREFAVNVAAAFDKNPFVRVLTIAMDYCVRKGFTQSQFNFDLASVRVSKVQDEPYELINEW